MTKKMEKKYIPLAEFFRNTLQNEVTLTYTALENIMGQQLPNAAYLNGSWWTKTKSPLNHYLAWHEADFTVTNVQLGNSITFVRNSSQYSHLSADEPQYNIIIRPMEILDARPLINLQTEIYATSPFEYYEQDEYTMSVQLLKKKMAEWKVRNNSTVLIAVVDGQHVGYIEISGRQTSRQQHIAKIRIGVIPSYQASNIASMLLEKCLIWSKAHYITKLEAEVIEQNDAAIRLLQKFDFELEGTRRQAVYTNEQHYNELYYSKLLTL